MSERKNSQRAGNIELARSRKQVDLLIFFSASSHVEKKKKKCRPSIDSRSAPNVIEFPVTIFYFFNPSQKILRFIYLFIYFLFFSFCRDTHDGWPRWKLKWCYWNFVFYFSYRPISGSGIQFFSFSNLNKSTAELFSIKFNFQSPRSRQKLINKISIFVLPF